MSRVQTAIKRATDVIVSFVALIFLSPLLLLIALAVRLTSLGPALFHQIRLGKDGKPFTCYKFCTMVVNAPDIRNPDGSTFNAEADPRVTRIGHLLRKTTLDELPQLINVLKGEMSLIGPRPDPVDVLELYSERDKKRLSVKPGMAGLAFIYGRNLVPLERRRELDVDYVEHYSLCLDFQILLKSAIMVLLRKGVFASSQKPERQA